MTQSTNNSVPLESAAGLPSASESQGDRPSAASSRGILFRIAKWLTIALVLGALAWQIRKLAADWATDGGAVLQRGIAWPWLGVALIVFLLGQCCFALYWRRLVQAAGVEAPLMPTIRAYLVGTIGKYVPGKALVVVVRSGMLPTAKGRRFLVGGAAVYETMTSMAAAGLIASVAIAATRIDLDGHITGAAAIALILNIAIHPGPFRRLTRAVTMPFSRGRTELPVRSWYRCYWRSAPLWLMEWIGSGLSLWATAAAFHLDVFSPGDIVYLTGVASLATAAGFLVLPVPAGLGVREFVVIFLLQKWLEAHHAGVEAHALAVCVSLLLRTVWTIGEVALAGGLYLLPGVSWRRAKTPNGDAETAQ